MGPSDGRPTTENTGRVLAVPHGNPIWEAGGKDHEQKQRLTGEPGASKGCMPGSYSWHMKTVEAITLSWQVCSLLGRGLSQLP